MRAGCVSSRATLKPKDGRIQLLSLQTGTISAGDQKACGEAYPKYVAWAEANRPEDWKKVSQPVLYDLKGRALGDSFAKLCKEYAEATKK